MYGFGDSYIAPFALLVRAGNRAMAFLGTAPLMIGALGQLAGAALADRLPRRKPILVVTTALHAAAWLALFWLPFFFRGAAVAWILVLGALIAWLASFGSPAWTSWMGDVVQPNERGRYFARRNTMATVALVASMLAAAGVLSAGRRAGLPWLGFGLLFATATAARAVSCWLLSRHHEPPAARAPDAYFSFWDYLHRAPRSNFTKFSFAIAMMNGAVNIAGPFFSVYMLRDLHWTYVQFTLNTVVYLLAQFVVYRWWGAICDRHGARVVIKATSVLLPVLPLLWAVMTNFGGLMAVQALSGCTWAGFNLATTNFIYDAVTPPKRARVVSYHGLLNAFFTLIGGSVIGATLANRVPAEIAIGPWHIRQISSLPTVFVVSAIVRILAAAVMLPRFREVRPVDKVSTWTLLRRLGSGEPVIAAGVEMIHRLPILGRMLMSRSPEPSSAPTRPEGNTP